VGRIIFHTFMIVFLWKGLMVIVTLGVLFVFVRNGADQQFR
jgi:hypothetical protein